MKGELQMMPPIGQGEAVKAVILIAGFVLSIAIHIAAYLHFEWALNRTAMRLAIAILAFFALMSYFRGSRTAAGGTQNESAGATRLLRGIAMLYIFILMIGGAFVGVLRDSGTPHRPPYTLYPAVRVTADEYDFINVIIFSGTASCVYVMLLTDTVLNRSGANRT